MSKSDRSGEDLFHKLLSLPPDKLAEVEDFVDFLRYRDDGAKLSAAVGKLSEDAFRKVWDNPEDAEYDRL